MSRPLKTGEIIDGRYQITGMLGHGSAAQVYSATDRVESRGVALKVMRDNMRDDAAARQRFEREAAVQAKLCHRNIAAIFGSGYTPRKNPYIVIELLHGRSLRHVIAAEAPVSSSRAGSYAWQALSGLAAMHDVGVLHRDLKPGNLMLEPSPGPIERVVLIDFGFASLEGGGRITATGHVVGSLGYLAPERLLGSQADARSDIYGIGVLLFELLAGRRPFVADRDLELVNAHLKEPVPAIADVAPAVEVPSGLEEVARIALAKDPAERFATATAMADALAAAVQE